MIGYGVRSSLLVICLCSPYTLYAMERVFRGFIDTYHGMRLQSPYDFLSSRTRVRLESQISQQNTLAFISVNAAHNDVVSSETGVTLREAYIDYVTDIFDFRIGRQIIIWGQAEGFQVTDIISPKDYSEYLARDFDEMRLPVDALKTRLLGDFVTLECIWIPVFTAAEIPYYQEGVTGEEDKNPWAQELPAGVTVNETEKPELKVKNSEIAGKFSLNTSLLDLSLSAFHTWDDIPTMHQDGLSITPRHHRLTVFGTELVIPVSDFVFRGESVFNKGKYLATVNGEYVQKNTVISLAGIDWSPGSNWSLSAQFYDVYIRHYNQEIENEKNTMYCTLTISKSFLRETLTLSTMVFYGIDYHDSYNRSYIEYLFNDQLCVMIGSDWFRGDEGMFGLYNDNSQVFLKVKYSF
jgi:hypothetical protein